MDKLRINETTQQGGISFDAAVIEAMPEVEWVECPRCHGEGIIREPYLENFLGLGGTLYWQNECELCEGTGNIASEKGEEDNVRPVNGHGAMHDVQR